MKEDFGKRLKALLEQKRLSLTEVGRAINISAPSVHRWTRGGEIDDENLRSLAKFLDVNWIWLRYGDEAIQSLHELMADGGPLADERRRYIGDIMASQARLSLAQEMARIVTWEWNALTDELTLGPGGDQIFRRPADAVKHAILPFRRLNLEEIKTKFSAQEVAPDWDSCLSSAGGESNLWFTSRGKLVLDAYERPSRIIGVSIDITRRKQMEEALAHSEYVLRKVIETIPVGLFIADANGNITTANPEAERIWGGAKLVGLEHYGDYKGRWAATDRALGADDWTLSRAVRLGEASEGEVVHIDAFDGANRTIVMWALPLLDQRQDIIGAIEVNQDITELRRAEASQRSMAEQWSEVFNQPSLGIAYEKHGDSHLYTNARMAELLGTTPDQLDAACLADLLDAPTRQAFERKVNAKGHGGAFSFELQGRLERDGFTVSARLRVTRYSSDSKGAFRTLAFVTQE